MDDDGAQSGGETQQPGGPLADRSAQSIMSNVEVPPSRTKRLESGLSIGPKDSDGLELKSRSVGNLSSVSVESLRISPSKGEDDKEVLSDGDEGDVPTNEEGTAEYTGTSYIIV